MDDREIVKISDRLTNQGPDPLTPARRLLICRPQRHLRRSYPVESCLPSVAAMCSAARMARAAMVSVGGDALAVTKSPLPTRYRFTTSCAFRSEPTTLERGSAP